MAYIGIQPAEKFTSCATQEFYTSATTSYTLDHAVANENELALFINNVRQQPGSGKAYTATGTALTLSAATASTDTMYCVFLGRALQTITPATNSITNAMITNNTIESGKLFSTFKNGITVADQFRLTTSFTNAASPIASNWEEVDTLGYGGVGSYVSQSSGKFTFSTTGFYKVEFSLVVGGNVDNRIIYNRILYSSNNGSSYSTATSSGGFLHTGAYRRFGSYSAHQVDITDTSNHCIAFAVAHQEGTTANETLGDTTISYTNVIFTRLGDT